MTYIGTLTVIAAVLFAWRTYCAFLHEELSDTRAFLNALRDYREKMKCYLDSPAAWAHGYTVEPLASSEFIKRVAGGEPISSAYSDTRDAFCLPCDIDEVISDCFSRLGEGYLDTELAALDGAISRIAEREGRMADDIARRTKVAGALLGACAVGIVILVI